MKIGINFHNTFPPDVNYLSRLLAFADGKQRSLAELADITGIPQGSSTGKVNPHLSYLMLMGLLEEDHATPTALGAIVREEDPGCQEPITQWLMHANLTSVEGAEMWHYVYRELLPMNSGKVSQEYLADHMAAQFGAQTRYAVITSCYTKGLTAIHYLDESTGIKVASQKLHRDYLFLYAYELLREWEAVFPGEQEITANQLYLLHSAECFGLTQEQWFEALEQMSSKRLIRLNRQLTPFTIIRGAKKEEVANKIYSLLI